MVENPGDLGGGEVRVDDKAGLPGDFGLVRLELLASLGCPAVLPNQGRRERSAGGSFPHDCGFPLIGQPDRRDPIRFNPSVEQRAGDLRAYRTDEGIGIVFHPSRLRIGGKDLELTLTDRAKSRVVDDGTSARRSLINHQEMLSRHAPFLYVARNFPEMRIELPKYHAQQPLGEGLLDSGMEPVPHGRSERIPIACNPRLPIAPVTVQWGYETARTRSSSHETA